MVSPNAASAFVLDANGNPISFQGMVVTKKTIAFDGSAGNGAVGSVSIFTVTGNVLVQVFGICTESLAGATATLALGLVGNTTAFIGTTTGTNITAGTEWVDTGPSTGEAPPTVRIIPAGIDIIGTIATANITDGTIDFFCLWAPLDASSSVAAA